ISIIGKVLRINPYNFVTIKKRLMGNVNDANDFLLLKIEDIERDLVALSRFYRLECNWNDLYPFIRKLKFFTRSNLKQTKLDDWFIDGDEIKVEH
ncbi:MAG: hypothetical protein ACTSRA_12345, partial [Promethearchaeota archaeon]